MEKKVYKTVDFTKFICAYMVMTVHAISFLYREEVWWIMLEHNVFRTTVPYFFLVSGFFYGKKMCTIAEKKAFFWQNMKNLFIHYIVWGVLYDFINALYNFRHGMSPKQAAITFALDSLNLSSNIMWYVSSLMVAMAILYFIKTKKALLISIAAGGIAYLFGVYIGSYVGSFMGTPFGAAVEALMRVMKTTNNGILVGYIFVSIGYLFGRYKDEIKLPGVKKSLVLGVIGYIIINVEMYILLHLPIVENNNFDFLAGYLLVCPAIFFLTAQIEMNCFKSTAFFRKTSSFIYFSHMLVLVITRTVSDLPVLGTWLVATVGVTLGAYIVYKWNNKYINMII